MNIFVVLFLLLGIPFVAFLGKPLKRIWFYTQTHPTAVFLALSSCLGDGLRTRIAGARIDPRHGVYGRSYARGLGSFVPAGSEQIEMEDVMRRPWIEEEDEDDL